jgi:hypothetical protein
MRYRTAFSMFAAAIAVPLAVAARSDAQIYYARPYSGSYFRNTNYGPGIYQLPNTATNLRYSQLRSAYPAINPVVALNPYARESLMIMHQQVPTASGGYYHSQPVTGVAPQTSYFYPAPTSAPANNTGYFTTASDVNSGFGGYYSSGYQP